MREVIRGAQFKRDVKRAEKRKKDLNKLRTVILLLMNEAPLPQRLQDHALAGTWKHHRDLHIEPDWLLLYKVDGDRLYLVRTGTHADLFGA